MSGNKKCLTLIWEIKNFNFSFKKSEIYSPLFHVNIMSGNMFKLLLNPNSGLYPDCVACYMKRVQNDPGPKHLEIDYELSFVSFDGSVLQSERFLKRVNQKGNLDTGLALCVKRNEMYNLNKDLFIPDDNLIICCRIWDPYHLISQSGRCFVETRIETDCRSFVGTIGKFSSIEPGENYPLCFKSSTENCLSFIYLRVAADGKLDIEIQPAVSGLFSEYKCTLFILDTFGNKVKFGKGGFHDTKSQCIPITLLKEHLIENKEYYLPNNVLTIECEIIFPTGKTTESINEPEYGLDYQDTQEMIYNAKKTKFSSKEYHPESLTTLKDDLNLLFREGILCDAKLKTATETFPVHKNVLSARSPVFKSMFTTDMQEKTNNSVHIDDLDADTVRRMLDFMYTDTLNNLEYESAKSLFFAADKYSIAPLRYECLNFLKQNILQTNCCDILLLADRHQDKHLKNAVYDYIAENDEAVFFSDEFKNLEKNHPQLTIDALRTVYMKNRKS